MIMTENIDVVVELMMRDEHLATFSLYLNDDYFVVNNLKFHKDCWFSKLFYNENLLKMWMLSRLMPSCTRHYISMMPIIFPSCSKRFPYAQLALSLQFNGISLSDNFWFNPKETVILNYKEISITFCKIESYDMLSYDQLFSNNELNDFTFNDILLKKTLHPAVNFTNPILTTNGIKQKQWKHDEANWILRKRKTTQQIKNEKQCLEFFKNMDILVSDYNVNHNSVNDKYQFNPMTIKSGFYTIEKQCLTSKDSQLIPMSWLVNSDIDSIKQLLTVAKSIFDINESEITKLHNAINGYQNTFNCKRLELSNFGFLVDKNNVAVPVVWSGIQYYDDSEHWNALFADLEK